MMNKSFVICINNDEYPVSLEVRKVYERLNDDEAEALHLLRIIDESGEDYLYPQQCFIAIDIPDPVKQSLVQVCEQEQKYRINPESLSQ